MKRIIILLAISVLLLSACVSNTSFKAEQTKTQALDSKQNKQEAELEMLRKDYLEISEKIELMGLKLEGTEQDISRITPLQNQVEASEEDLAFLQDEIANLVDRVADLINDQNAVNKVIDDQKTFMEQKSSAQSAIFAEELAKLRTELEQSILDQTAVNKMIDDQKTIMEQKSSAQSAILAEELAKLRTELNQSILDTDFILDAFTDQLVAIQLDASDSASKEELSTLIQENEQLAITLTELMNEVKGMSEVSDGDLTDLCSEVDDLREIVVDLYSEFLSSGMVASEDMEQRFGDESNKRTQMMNDILARIQAVEEDLKGSIGSKSVAVGEEIVSLRSQIDQMIQELDAAREEQLSAEANFKAEVGEEIVSLRSQVDQIAQELDAAREEQLSAEANAKAEVASLRKTVESLSMSVKGVTSDLSELDNVIQDERAKKEKRRQMDIKAQYNVALTAYNKHKNEESIRLFEDFLSQYPYESLSVNAYYWIGENYYAAKKWSTAADYFQEVVQNYPNHGKAADASLKLGMAYYNMELKAQARDIFEQLKEYHPKYNRMDLVNKYLRLTARY